MKKTATILTLCVLALVFAAPGTALAQEEKTSQELKLDSQRAKINEVIDGNIETDIAGFDGFVVGYLPLGIADIFVKAGVIAWDASISGQVGGDAQSQSEDGTDPAYGLGVQFRIKSFAIRGEVEYFDIEGAEYVYMYSIGGCYTF